MQDCADALDDLDRERASLRDALRLHSVHWGALLLSILLALAAWHVARDVAHDRERLRFEHEAGLVADTFEWRLERTGAADADAVRALMHGTLDPARRLVGLAASRAGVPVYDDDAAGPGDASAPARARERIEVPLAIDDGIWSLRLWSTPRLERRSRRYLPDAVLAGGLVIEFLLVALFVAQSRGSRRTLAAAGVAAALSTELRARTLDLERANADLERFACTASHDLKAPLQGILMQLQLAGLDLDDVPPDVPGLRRRLGLMEGRVARLRRLIDDVLAYSSATSSGARTSDVDIVALVQDIGDSLGVPSGRLSVSTDVAILHTDAARLGQVLSNLVANAFKYHLDPAAARVRVACERLPGAVDVMFRVEDDGPGIAPEHHARVFEMFGRLPAPVARAGTAAEPPGPEGTGVGLAIVRRAVEAVGGTVALESSPGVGARFSFTWPAAREEPARA